MKFLDLLFLVSVFSFSAVSACAPDGSITEGTNANDDDDGGGEGGEGGNAPDESSGGAAGAPQAATGGNSVAGQAGSPAMNQAGGSSGAAGRAGGRAGASSVDAGAPVTSAPDANPPAGPTENKVPAIVAVGYGGVRVLSRDGGKTWTNRQALAAQGGDDFDLLRAVGWFDGQFVAVGWKVMTSQDGVTWIERKKSGLHDCVSFANGMLYIKNLRGGDAMVSKDKGVTWTNTSGNSVACSADPENLSFDNVRLESVWQGFIERSEGGQSAKRVYDDPQDNHISAFAKGWAAP